jgi:7,8-dihydropterin-6-yl-methyl-4-(beta-D-ribofuranosyl)aminobenzene 5'-phosphate synthase
VRKELLIVVDNTAGGDLKADHGLAMLISGGGCSVLFDCGPSTATLDGNARAVGVSLGEVSAVVLSHGHLDHTGGLPHLAAQRPGLDVFAHPGAFCRRWVGHPGKPLKDISCPLTVKGLHDRGGVLHPVRAPEMMQDWLLISGPVGGPRHGPDHFIVRKDDEMVVDVFEDEIFALVRGRDGWTLLSGCCHRGLRNTLRAARFISRGEPITAIVGGLHLGGATMSELAETAELLRQHGSPRLYPCHCSGAEAVGTLRSLLGALVQPAAAGMRLEL